MSKRLKIRKGCRIDIIDKITEDTFWGRYKGYDINIDREEDGSFCIIVQSEEMFGTAYDGYWHDEHRDLVKHRPMKEAIEQALIGSGLILTLNP